MDVSITGIAYSPINPSWTYGPVDVSFQLTGGNHGAQVTDFSLGFDGQHIAFPTATANDYFTATRSGIAVFAQGTGNTSNFVFVWNSDGTGGFKDSEQAVYMHFNPIKMTDWVTTPEPGVLALLVPALVLLWFRFRSGSASSLTVRC